MRKWILGGLAAATLGALALPAAARTQVDFYVNVGPPAGYHYYVPDPVYVPDPFPARVWVPGYWTWRHGHRVWVSGHWSGPARHYDRWSDRHHRHDYRRARGRDADRDGVPNRYDRAPFDPYWY